MSNPCFQFTFKRMTRIELATPAWEAEVLSAILLLLYTKMRVMCRFFSKNLS